MLENGHAESAERLLCSWLALPQLGRVAQDWPTRLHLLEEPGHNCLDSAKETLHQTPLSNWLRTPVIGSQSVEVLDLPSLDGAAVMDAYLLSLVDWKAFILFQDLLCDTEMWCAHFDKRHALIGGFAEIVSLGIASEITTHFFRSPLSSHCSHRRSGAFGEKAFLWDPRLLVPTPSGYAARTELISGQLPLAGPHALLRSTMGFLPELAPLENAVDIGVDALFQSENKDSFSVIFLVEEAGSSCEITNWDRLGKRLHICFSWAVKISRPIRMLVPAGARLALREKVGRLANANFLSARKMASITRQVGFQLPVLERDG